MCQTGNCTYEEGLSGNCILKSCILIKDIDNQMEASGFKLELEEPKEMPY